MGKQPDYINAVSNHLHKLDEKTAFNKAKLHIMQASSRLQTDPSH
jgi:hypothetical protein